MVSDKNKNILFYVSSNACCIVCIFVILPLLFFLVILLPTSLATVGYDRWGIAFNSATQTVGQTTYSPGMYWIGIGKWFITFPKTFTSVHFNYESKADGTAIDSRTKDGLSIKLEISLQYKIEQENVQWVFDKFALNYEDIVNYIARDITRDVCAQFNAFDFFTSRTTIGVEIEDEIRAELEKINITLGYLQLRSVDLPDEYEAIIESNEIQRQKTYKAELDQEALKVSAETETLVAMEKSQVKIIEAEATAQGYLYDADASANVTKTEMEARIEIFNNLQTDLGFTNDDLVTFSFTEVISNHNEDEMLISMKAPSDFDF